MKEPICSVGFTGTPGDGAHIKPSSMFTFTVFPKGYGPSMEDRMACALFVPSGSTFDSALARGERHPLVDAIAKAIDAHIKEHPDEVIGFLEH